MRIEWSEEAGRDMLELRRYIADRNPAAANATAVRIVDSIDRLAAFPASGRPGHNPGTRVLVVAGTPYRVSYWVRDEIVEILRVIHGARRWE